MYHSQSKLRHCWNRTEYREESWRLGESCCHSDASKKPSDNAGVNDTDHTVTNRMFIIRKQKWEEKQLYGRFKRLINDIWREKTRTLLRKRNFKRETESLLIAARNNAIRTNQIKARIDKTQQNSRGRLCGDRDETINHIISECSKLAQKVYKTRHDWELCKKFKFDHTNKWYMHNPAAVMENDT